MRKRKVQQGVTVNAIAGTNVVLLGFDLAANKRSGCLGFALRRQDHTEGDDYWLKGMKTFRTTNPGLGGQASSRQHPFQAFQWADYSAKPNHDYTYTAVPLYGTPAAIVEGDHVSVRLTTEPEIGVPHSAFFNRGAAASQEYARRFQNKTPSKYGDDAYRWLSRGLEEALLAFIARARDPSYGLRGAIYEFQWPSVLGAIKDAKGRGADVKVVYDDIATKGPGPKNIAAIAAAKIKSLCLPRERGKLMHNKFLVLTKNGAAVSVWTGSTNCTENGIFGQSNFGHIVEDASVATEYLNYWEELKGDPVAATEKAWMAQHNPAPPNPWSDDLTAVFSPRTGLAVLDWYAQIAGGGPLFMTFAFGMHKKFQAVYEQPDGVLRIALMEKEGTGSGLAQGKRDIARIRKLPNVVVALGNFIATNSFDRWVKERATVTGGVHVLYIHTKYMLVDPLGPKPVVVAGSANFSKASTDENNENMLVIKNDKRVADIYLGEFMRLYAHYAYRESVARAKRLGITADEWSPQYLVDDDSWQADHFQPGHQRFLRREYFAG